VLSPYIIIIIIIIISLDKSGNNRSLVPETTETTLWIKTRHGHITAATVGALRGATMEHRHLVSHGHLGREKGSE